MFTAVPFSTLLMARRFSSFFYGDRLLNAPILQGRSRSRFFVRCSFKFGIFFLLLFRRYLEILCDVKDLHVESVLLGKYNHIFFF